MAERTVLAHSSPGRARLRIGARRKDAAFFAELVRGLAQAPGVEHVSANPLTGSVLLLHGGELETIFAYAEQHQLFARPQASVAHDDVLEAVAHSLGVLDDRLLEQSEGRWGLSRLGFYALVAAASYQVYRGQIFPAAETLLQHALKMVPHLRKPAQ